MITLEQFINFLKEPFNKELYPDRTIYCLRAFGIAENGAYLQEIADIYNSLHLEMLRGNERQYYFELLDTWNWFYKLKPVDLLKGIREEADHLWLEADTLNPEDKKEFKNKAFAKYKKCDEFLKERHISYLITLPNEDLLYFRDSYRFVGNAYFYYGENDKALAAWNNILEIEKEKKTLGEDEKKPLIHDIENAKKHLKKISNGKRKQEEEQLSNKKPRTENNSIQAEMSPKKGIITPNNYGFDFWNDSPKVSPDPVWTNQTCPTPTTNSTSYLQNSPLSSRSSDHNSEPENHFCPTPGGPGTSDSN